MLSCDEVRFTIVPLGITFTASRLRGSTYCGDGVLQAVYEACDDGNGAATDACKPDCTANVCGDGLVRIGVERCDHGGAGAGSGCAADCSALEPEGASGSVGPFALIVTTDGEGDGATGSDDPGADRELAPAALVHAGCLAALARSGCCDDRDPEGRCRGRKLCGCPGRRQPGPVRVVTAEPGRWRRTARRAELDCQRLVLAWQRLRRRTGARLSPRAGGEVDDRDTRER